MFVNLSPASPPSGHPCARCPSRWVGMESRPVSCGVTAAFPRPFPSSSCLCPVFLCGTTVHTRSPHMPGAVLAPYVNSCALLV